MRHIKALLDRFGRKFVRYVKDGSSVHGRYEC